MKKYIKKLFTTSLAIAVIMASASTFTSSAYADYTKIQNETVLYGDVNLNGRVSADDALTVLKYTVSDAVLSEKQLFSADLNCDGDVNIQDAISVLEYSIRLISIKDLPYDTPDFKYSKYTALSESDYWCYNQLTADQKKLYETILKSIKEFESGDILLGDYAGNPDSNKPDDELFSSADVKIAFFAINHDHPEIFWVSNGYTLRTLQQSDENAKVYIVIDEEGTGYSYLYSKDEAKKLSEEIDQKANEVLDSVLSTGMSDYDASLSIYDWLVTHVTYDYEALNDNHQDSEYQYAWQAYGSLLKGRAVCEGFSRAYQLLLYKIGINANLIDSDADALKSVNDSVGSIVSQALNDLKLTEYSSYLTDRLEGAPGIAISLIKRQ